MTKHCILLIQERRSGFCGKLSDSEGLCGELLLSGFPQIWSSMNLKSHLSVETVGLSVIEEFDVM